MEHLTNLYNDQNNNLMNKLEINSLELSILNYKDILQKNFNYLITTKKHSKHDLILIHNKWDVIIKSKIYKELNSIVFKIVNDKLVPFVFTYPSIINNQRDNINIESFNDTTYKVWESIEGTIITFFKYDNEWIIMTPRCFDIDKSKFANSNSFGEQLNDILNENNMSRDELLNKLEELNVDGKSYSHSFVLVHRDNSHLIDYKNDNLGFLSYILSRDTETGNKNYFSFDNISEKLIKKNTTYEFNNCKELKDFMSVKLNDIDMTLDVTNHTIGSHGYIIEKQIDDNYSEFYRIHSEEYLKLVSYIPKNNTVVENIITSYQNNNIVKYLDVLMQQNNNFIQDKSKYLIKVKCMFNFLVNCVYTIYLHFTDFDTNTGKYTKINDEDFKMLENCNYIKYTISKLQNLVLYQFNHVKSTKSNLSKADILRHLHNPKYTDTNELINLLLELVLKLYCGTKEKQLWNKLCNNTLMVYKYIGYKVNGVKNYDLLNSVYVLNDYVQQLKLMNSNDTTFNEYETKLNMIINK